MTLNFLSLLPRSPSSCGGGNETLDFVGTRWAGPLPTLPTEPHLQAPILFFSSPKPPASTGDQSKTQLYPTLWDCGTVGVMLGCVLPLGTEATHKPRARYTAGAQ